MPVTYGPRVVKLSLGAGRGPASTDRQLSGAVVVLGRIIRLAFRNVGPPASRKAYLAPGGEMPIYAVQMTGGQS
jgi:hypothetical protein